MCPPFGTLAFCLTLCLVITCVRSAASGSLLDGVTFLRVTSRSPDGSSEKYENYCAYSDQKLAMNLSQNYRSAVNKQIVDLSPSNGCQHGNATYAGRVIIVLRGGCTYTQKAINAYAQDASGLIVVSYDLYPPYIQVESPLLPANYQVSLISKVAYQSMKSQFLSSSDATAAVYRPVEDAGSLKQYMFLILDAIAMFAMIVSCIAAATGLRQFLLTRARQANSSSNAANELDLSNTSRLQMVVFIAVLIAVPITILLLLNFAYDYFVWVMLVLYGYSVASSLVYYVNRVYLMIVAKRLEGGPRPWLAITVEWDLGKCCGKISFTYMEFVAYPFCLAVAVFWFVFRNTHWAFILTNLLNIVLVMRVIESLVLALRIKIATILLVCFLVYDVFFVFITPLFSRENQGQTPAPASPTTPRPTESLTRVRRDTVMDYYIDRGGSIMERVALGTAGMSGEIIPIVFKVMPYPPPESITTCLSAYSILGLGDVILPAILLGLNLFFDLAWSNRFWPYFSSSLIAYLLGLGVCAGVLFASGKGQPALLYIVPLILIASYLCAAIRREVKLYFYTALPDHYRVLTDFDPEGAGENLPDQPQTDRERSDLLQIPRSPEKVSGHDAT